MELYEIVMLVVGLGLLVAVSIAYYTKKDYLKYSSIINPLLQSILGVLQVVGGILPSNSAVSIMMTVISTSIDAAGYAETLWINGEINKDARPQYAQEYITTILTRAGIEVTENINSIISGVIALTCYLMPHDRKVSEE